MIFGPTCTKNIKGQEETFECHPSYYVDTSIFFYTYWLTFELQSLHSIFQKH